MLRLTLYIVSPRMLNQFILWLSLSRSQKVEQKLRLAFPSQNLRLVKGISALLALTFDGARLNREARKKPLTQKIHKLLLGNVLFTEWES